MKKVHGGLRLFDVLPKCIRTLKPGRRPVRKDSALFVGYAEAALGLGESFRNMLRALDSAGMPFAIYPFKKDVETRLTAPFLAERYDLTGIYEINIAYLAPPMLPFFYQELKSQLKGGGYTILRTYWELPEAPRQWAPLLEPIDELWAPNAFVADAFRGIFDGPITIVPVCIEVTRKAKYAREHFALDGDRFYFLFSFDYYSGPARKNPIGVVQAFSYAFPHDDKRVGLIIKATGAADLDPGVSLELENVSRIDERIRVISNSMSRDEMLSLIDASDCYVSLHRSEGFGLGMAESLAFGKPVIGTSFSGNSDYLTEETGFPVPFVLRPLMPGEYPSGDGQSWAEPDLAAAIAEMRRVFTDRNESRRRAARGKEYIETHHSGAPVAKIIRERLAAIRQSQSRASLSKKRLRTSFVTQRR